MPPAGDDWFLGIDGVPVGPIGLTEVRARAASGSANQETLVWREGFEEWLPLSKFPELVAVVEEGMSSARASIAPLAAASLEQPDPFAPEASPAPFAVAPPADSRQVVEDEIPFGKQRSGINVPAIFAMLIAVAFGLTIGFVLFGGEQTPVAQVPPSEGKSEEEKDSAARAEKADEARAEAAPDEAPSEEPGQQEGQPAKTTAGSTTTPSPGKATRAATPNEGLKGLSGLKGLATGPSAGPGASSGDTTGGRPLDSSQVQSTVSRYTGSVKRSCWQPALDTRDKGAPTSARVSVTITVGADGRVTNATTSGDPRGYHGLSTCIARRVRTWSFPRSSGTTTVNVPFVFAAQ